MSKSTGINGEATFDINCDGVSILTMSIEGVVVDSKILK